MNRFQPLELASRTAAGFALSILLTASTGADGSADSGHCHLSRWVPGEIDAFAEAGNALAFDGQTAVVGAPGQGAVFVYERQGSGWSQVQMLESPAWVWAEFGTAVGLFEDCLLVGAPYDNANGTNSGSVFLYQRTGSNWDLVHTFVGLPESRFGSAVDMVKGATTRVFVGAPGVDGGAVHVFEPVGNFWFTRDYLKVAGSVRFGASLDVDNTTLIVGDWGDATNGSNAGAIHSYIVTDALTDYVQKITASDGVAWDYFGFSIAVDDKNRIVVGAHGNDEFGPNAGAAYVYEYAGFPFHFYEDEVKVLPCGVSDSADFGHSVDIDEAGDKIVIGAYDDDNGVGGSVHVYRPDFFFPGTWTVQDVITPADGVANDAFGWEVRIAGSQVLASSPGADAGTSETGATYLVSLTRKTWGGGQCPCDILAGATSYGVGKPGTLGIPTLSVDRPPVPGEASLFKLQNVLAGLQPVIFWGSIPAAIPFDGGELYMADPNGELMPLATPLNQVGVQWVVPAMPALCGSDVYFQAMFLDPGAAGQYRTAQSNGLHTVVGY